MSGADGSSPTTPSQFEIEHRHYEDVEVQRLVAEVQAEYVRMYGGPDAAVIDPEEFIRPFGLLLVGVLAGDVVAMGGWRRIHGGPERAELKRMYVMPHARRRGLSRHLLTAIEQDAIAAGIREMVLNTGPEQHGAIALYRDAGYTVTAPFGHYATMGEALFYAKKLVPDPTT